MDYADIIACELGRLQRIRDRTVALIASLSKGEVDPAIYSCLYRLAIDGPMRSGALAEALYSDPSTVSRQVAHLVERGLVERRADPGDGRAIVLAVTENGRRMADTVRARRTENIGRVIGDWPESDRAEFVRLLGRFLNDYERTRPDMIAAMKREYLKETR